MIVGCVDYNAVVELFISQVCRREREKEKRKERSVGVEGRGGRERRRKKKQTRNTRKINYNLISSISINYL